MRRKEFELAEPETVDGVISGCDCCRIALADTPAPYIVPLNFAYVHGEGRRCFYFHGAASGRKMELIRRGGHAGFELDCRHELNSADKACRYSFKYSSVVGHGSIAVVEDQEEKRLALRLIMLKYSGRSDWEFDEAAVAAVAVFRLDIDVISGKARF